MNFKNMIASLLAIGALGTFAVAQQGGANPAPRDGDAMRRGSGRDFGRGIGRRSGMMPGMMNFSRLNLTDAQKQRIQALQETHSRAREAGQARRVEMMRLMRLKAAGLLTTEQGTRLTSLEAQMKTDSDRMRNEILAVLTPEQRTLAEQMMNSRGNFRRGTRGAMRGKRRAVPNRPGRPNRPERPPTPAAPTNN